MQRRWGTIDLLDILKEADFLTGFTSEFTSVMSREALPEGVLRRRLLLVLFALGTNVGIKRIADGLAVAGSELGDIEAALRRVRASHVTRDNLRKAIRRLVNATLAMRDPAWWGQGTACASDSKKFGSWSSNLMTEWHQRYRGPGIMIYWHVERGRVCIYSQLKTCSASRGRCDDRGSAAAPDQRDDRPPVHRHPRRCCYLDTLPLVEGQARPAGPSSATVRGCVCGYGSCAARMGSSGSTCWTGVVSRSRLCRGSSGFWWLGTARPTRSSLMPMICVICGGSSPVMV